MRLDESQSSHILDLLSDNSAVDNFVPKGSWTGEHVQLTCAFRMHSGSFFSPKNMRFDSNAYESCEKSIKLLVYLTPIAFAVCLRSYLMCIDNSIQFSLSRY